MLLISIRLEIRRSIQFPYGIGLRGGFFKDFLNSLISTGIKGKEITLIHIQRRRFRVLAFILSRVLFNFLYESPLQSTLLNQMDERKRKDLLFATSLTVLFIGHKKKYIIT